MVKIVQITATRRQEVPLSVAGGLAKRSPPGLTANFQGVEWLSSHRPPLRPPTWTATQDALSVGWMLEYARLRS